MKTIVFDLDGTLADITHRLHFIKDGNHDWDGFFAACVDDAPIPEMVALFQVLERTNLMLQRSPNVKAIYGPDEISLIIVSGRSDKVIDQTREWLVKHDIYTDDLYMREEGDHRPDYQVKQEICDHLKETGHEILLAFDDHQQVVDMWRANGVRCAQVDKGDF